MFFFETRQIQPLNPLNPQTINIIYEDFRNLGNVLKYEKLNDSTYAWNVANEKHTEGKNVKLKSGFPKSFHR